MANIGVRTGQESNLLVLDVDPRKAGDRSLFELETRYGKLPLTLRCATGGGGWHHYFQYPGRMNLWGQVPGFPGLDIKADGGYVVAPLSNHKSGGVYKWGTDFLETPIVKAPDWLIDLIRKDPTKKDRRQGVSGYAGPLPEVELGPDDEIILRQLENGVHGDRLRLLAQGRWEEAGEYLSPSEADWEMFKKLAFLTCKDPGRVFAIFQATGLFRGTADKKPFYYEHSINKACGLLPG